ncbi:MAG: FdhD protein [Saprospiraceae bacterium]|jgi:FdhD protein
MKSSKTLHIWKVGQDGKKEKEDLLAIEEPLEIRLDLGDQQKSISITMRTPGNDFELAAGFLFTEGIIQNKAQIKKIEHLKTWEPEVEGNIVLITLAKGVEIDFQKLERHFYTTSSCGICGKSSIDAVKATGLKPMTDKTLQFPAQFIHQLPAQLRQKQNIFDETGGLHAAALFDINRNLSYLREDVGRHNAVDKLIGTALLNEKLPLKNHLIMVSGRASFELIQKAAMAQIPILAAVGAPSSLAISLAEEVGMTVLGFVRNNRFNIYCGPERIL